MIAKNDAADFLVAFEQYGDQTAIIWQDKLFTYRHILNRIAFWKTRLNSIQSGSIVGLEGDFSPESIAILFVLIDYKMIIVPLDIHHTEKNLKKSTLEQ